MKKFFTTKVPAKPVYKHSWNQDGDEDPKTETAENAAGRSSASQASSARISPEKRKQPGSSQERLIFKSKISRTIMTREGSEEKVQEEEMSTQIRCSKTEKACFTVVKNVKEARQCHELGEAKEILADIKYLVGLVVDGENSRVKCLSVIKIAAKCQSAQFRAQMRAHGWSTKLFAALSDAPKIPSLAISTACVLYLLARDRLGITVDQKTLELIIELINLTPNDEQSASQRSDMAMDQSDDFYESCRMQVWKILNDWRQQTDTAAAAAALSSGGNSQSSSNSQRSTDSGDAGPTTTMMFDITLENLSARFLAIEALTFICCRTRDDTVRKWMKDSRRLTYFAQYLSEEAEAMLALDPKADNYASVGIERVKMLERYLRILEHCTFMNTQNQISLVGWESSSLVFMCAKLFKYFKALLDKVNIEDPSDTIMRLPIKSVITVITAVLKMLVNLSHSNVLCCGKLGDYDGFIGNCIDFITYTIPSHIQPYGRYDLMVLSLGLLINLVEPCNANRRLVIAYVDRTGERALIVMTKVFLSYEAAAQATDDEVDKVIENSQVRNGDSETAPVDVHETVAAALKSASRHMEESVVAAHVALFLGLVLQQNEEAVTEITSEMPDGKLDPMIAMMRKVLDFMRLTKTVSRNGEKTICKAIETFEHLS